MLLALRRTHLFRTLADTSALPPSPASTVASISPCHQRHYHAPPSSISTASRHQASKLLREHHHAPLLRRHTITSILLGSAAPQATHPPSSLLHQPCPHYYTTAPQRQGGMEAKTTGETRGKPIRCRAAVCRSPGEPLVLEEVMVAPPMPGEVRIRIICTSLCQSDITFWKLKDPLGCFPMILGHEAVGVVESVGENVTEVSEGDFVLPMFVPDCGECRHCRSPKSNLCSTFPCKASPYMPRYESSRFTDLKGEVIYHCLSVSSFSEYTVVDIAHVTKIDPTIPPNRACLFSCGVATGIGAAWKTAKVEKGSTVAIFGLGAVGLAVAEGARACGASRIIGVDLNPDKFEQGKKFGLTDFVNSANCGDKTASQAIIEMTDGGVDYAFECVGSTSLVNEAYNSCQKGWGKVTLVGIAKPGSLVSFSPIDILQGKSIVGSLCGSIKPKSDIPILIKRYKDKELNVDNFVTHEMKFEDVNKAFNLLLEGKSIRSVMWM